MINEFNLEWETSKVDIIPLDIVYRLDNPEIGTFYVTQAASEIAHKDNEHYYQYLSLIFENSIKHTYLLITNSEEKKQYLIKGNSNYKVFEWSELFDLFPKGIKEKQERILCNFANISNEFGFEIKRFDNYVFFAKDDNEKIYLINALKEKGLINIDISFTLGGGFIFTSGIVILENGWGIIEKIKNPDNLESKQAFIAMWFDESMNIAYSSIYRAIKELGFTPLRIDNKEHNNEISGEILYEIKKSRFIVADVTGQRHGVYFEAGFALGNRIPVIWTCKEEEKDKIHFDTRQYNHIIWENEEDLYDKIIKRIKGTIMI